MAKHEWIASTLGHGETMCKHCLMTNREAWVLGDECSKAPEPAATKAGERAGWSGDIRPSKRPDGVPTRCDKQWMTPAELAITEAMYAVEKADGSPAMTDAIVLLSKARDRVADHVEGQP